MCSCVHAARGQTTDALTQHNMRDVQTELSLPRVHHKAVGSPARSPEPQGGSTAHEPNFNVSDPQVSHSQSVTHGKEIFALAQAVEIPPAERQCIEVFVDRTEQRLCGLQSVCGRV